MILSPFQPMGNSFIINTSGAASTSQNTLVNMVGATGLGLTNMQPNIIRLFNKGSSDIWVSVTSAAATTVVIPVAGTTTLGTPQPVFFVEPGVDLIFTLPSVWIQTSPPGAGGIGQQYQFYINTISTGISQPLYGQFGEGM
jgi:hypothetical protein